MADSTDHAGRGERWVIAQMALLLAIALAPRLNARWPPFVVRLANVAGLLLGGAGAAIAGLAARDLGGNLTPLPKPKQGGALVKTGVYGLVRHPIYSGLILGAFGWSLLRQNPLSLALSVALALFFDRKAAREELWLAEAYPAYPAYRRRVRKLVPWLY